MLPTRKELIDQGKDPSLFIAKEMFDHWRNDPIHQKDLGDSSPDEDPDWVDEN